MKIGFFGGSFDPPHRGHIALARRAIERLHLDRVLIAPVGTQPLKKEWGASAPFEGRVAMVRLALAGEPRMEVSLIDAPRPDGKPNYTIDAIENLRRQLHPGDRLYCLMGADALLTISQWYRSADLLTACDFVVGSRPGFDLRRIAAALPDGISLTVEKSTEPRCMIAELRGADGKMARLYLLPDLAENISATEIRHELHARAGSAIAPAVAAYIEEHGLYRDAEEPDSSSFPPERKGS